MYLLASITYFDFVFGIIAIQKKKYIYVCIFFLFLSYACGKVPHSNILNIITPDFIFRILLFSVLTFRILIFGVKLDEHSYFFLFS